MNKMFDFTARVNIIKKGFNVDTKFVNGRHIICAVTRKDEDLSKIWKSLAYNFGCITIIDEKVLKKVEFSDKVEKWLESQECLYGLFKETEMYMRLYKTHNCDERVLFYSLTKALNYKVDPYCLDQEPMINLEMTMVLNDMKWSDIVGENDVTLFDVNNVREYYKFGDPIFLQPIDNPRNLLDEFFSGYFEIINEFHVKKGTEQKKLEVNMMFTDVTFETLAADNALFYCRLPPIDFVWHEQNMGIEQLERIISDDKNLVITEYPKRGCIFVGNDTKQFQKQVKKHLKDNEKTLKTVVLIFRGRRKREVFTRIKHPFTEKRTRLELFVDAFVKHFGKNVPLNFELITR